MFENSKYITVENAIKLLIVSSSVVSAQEIIKIKDNKNFEGKVKLLLVAAVGIISGEMFFKSFGPYPTVVPKQEKISMKDVLA